MSLKNWRFNMELYKGKNWEVVFVDWCQEFVGDCIISCNKESLSDLTDEDWQELGRLEKELERISKNYLMLLCLTLPVL